MNSTRLKIGDRAYCMVVGEVVTIDEFVTRKIGDREVLKIVDDTGREWYYDELMPRTRMKDTFWGRLFLGR